MMTTLAILIITILNFLTILSGVLPLEVIGAALDDLDGCVNDNDCDAGEEAEVDDGTVTDITLF